MEISGSDGYCRKCVPPAGFNGNTDIFSKLIMDGRKLCFGGGDGKRSVRINFPELAPDTLHHGLKTTVVFSEYFDKLFGTDFIGKRPETLSRSAGQ